MNGQLTLDDLNERARAANFVQQGLRADGRYLSIQQRFEEWLLTDDGRFMRFWLRDRALAMRRAGWRHYSIRTLWEAARWSRDVQVGPDAGFKLNDHYHSRMARRLMFDEPELEDFFELRALRA